MCSVPYETDPMAGLTVEGGGSEVFPVEIPGQCAIHKIKVYQTGGTPVDFAVDLFSKESAAYDQPGSESEGEETGRIPAEIYKVGDTLNGAAGVLDWKGEQMHYRSHDQTRGGYSRRIWLRISPEGSGQKTFCALLGVLTLE